MTIRESYRKELLKVMSQEQSYAFQKLTLLENRANKDFFDKQRSDKSQGSIVVMDNPVATSDPRLRNADLMRGKY